MSQSDYQEGLPEEAREIEKYRSVDVLSVLTLITGLLSFVALFKTTFWIFPLVAIAMGTVSLRSLARNPEKIGRKAAFIGIAIAIFFGAWAPARYVSRQYWLARRARTYADAWVELLRTKKLREAHQLHLPPSQRARSDLTLEEFYTKLRYSQSELDTFFAGEPLKTIVELQGDIAFEFDRLDDYDASLHSDTLTLRYLVRYLKRGREQVLPFRVVLERDESGTTGDHNWYVGSVTHAKTGSVASAL